MDLIADRISHVRTQIADASRQAGRETSEIALMAVSKTQPTEAVAEAHEGGHLIFGENRVQELQAKVPSLSDDIQWHLIGHLQKNKVRKVLPLVSCIDSVDSMALAQRIDRIAADLELNTRILLQVNIAADPAKSGFTPEEVRRDLSDLLSLKQTKVEGFMTIPSYDPDPEESRPHFAALRQLREEVATTEHPLTELSMGMSGDYAVAIAEGSTMVRVGTAIFGSRQAPST